MGKLNFLNINSSLILERVNNKKGQALKNQV